MTPIEQMRDPDATRDTLIEAISELRPQRAQWWIYNVSHMRFMLRLYRSSPSDYLMIATFWARQISGPTGWVRPKLTFDIETHSDHADGFCWLVRDSDARFSLECGKLYWGRNVGWNDESDWFSAYADPSGT
jgi:hypothetical protein